MLHADVCNSNREYKKTNKYTTTSANSPCRRVQVSWCFTPSQPVRLYQGEQTCANLTKKTNIKYTTTADAPYRRVQV